MSTTKANVGGLALAPCLHCGESRRSALAALILRIRGCACLACGGDGVVPAMVHEAWERGESGAAEWAEFWSTRPRWQRWLGI